MAPQLIHDVQTRIHEVRRTLDLLDGRLEGTHDPSEGARDLAAAVDGLRQCLWAVLTAGHEEKLPAYVGAVRVGRATESCEDVLADLSADALTADTPGIDAFHLSLTALLNTGPRI